MQKDGPTQAEERLEWAIRLILHDFNRSWGPALFAFSAKLWVRLNANVAASRSRRAWAACYL